MMGYLVIFYISLCLGAAHCEEPSSLIGNVDIVHKGRHCIQAARDVIEAVSQNEAQLAQAHLESLRADSKHLMRYAKFKIRQMESERSHLYQQLTKLEEQISESGRKEDGLKSEWRRAEVTLQRTIENRDTCRQQVYRAEDDLRHAQWQAHAYDAKQTGNPMAFFVFLIIIICGCCYSPKAVIMVAMVSFCCLIIHSQ